MLKPQDIYVLLKITANHDKWSYSTLAKQLYMSPSEVHASLKRSAESRLFDSNRKRVRRKELLEFLLHGVPYAYPARRGGMGRGMKTSFAAPPLSKLIESDVSIPPVWPDATGADRGYEIEPLHHKAPFAAKEDDGLYELLSLVDALREGRARERQIASEELEARLK